MTFTKILEEYWPQVSDVGIESIASHFDNTSETFLSDARNLLTLIEETVRDDISENGGTYKDFKRRADFEFRALAIIFGATLSMSMTKVYEELPAKLSEGYHLYVALHFLYDMLGTIKETPIYTNSETVRVLVDSNTMYLDKIKKELQGAAKSVDEDEDYVEDIEY